MITVKMFTFSPLQENTYVLYNEHKECCIIDPGCYNYNERKELKDFITGSGLLPKYLLNTHCHLDHIFGNRFVADTFQLELYLHPLEEKVLSFGPATAQLWGLPFEPYEGKTHFLSENDLIRLGEDEFSILFTPGHSPGSICFYNEKQSFLMGGDVLFQRSIGRTDLPGGSHETLLNSIRTRLFTLPDPVTVYPGHGPATTIGAEKKSNPFLNGEI